MWFISFFKYNIFPCSDETIDNNAGQKDSPVEAGKFLVCSNCVTEFVEFILFGGIIM